MIFPSLPKSCSENFCLCFASLLTSLLWTFSPEDEKFNKQVKIEPKEYDFIVVGAGSAGCVVANRLTEIDHWNVMLLERGGEEPLGTDIPGLVFHFGNTAIDWNYTTQAEEGSCLINKGCKWPRGKVMGGSSSINGMMYVRGNKEDFNKWAKLGNKGWSYKDVLPYFKKSEDNKDPEIVKQNPDYHATGGYLTVSKYPFLSPSGKIIEEAFNELGYETKDINAESQLGITSSQVTTDNGERKSTNAAFIRPIRGTRPNLIVKNEVYVTKILIDPITKKAKGVEYTSIATGKCETVMAKKEVIISAGVVNSPKLLMVSGVGPAEELGKHGIKVIQNLPVGHNLQDHFGTMGAIKIIKNVSSNDKDSDADVCGEKVGNLIFYGRTGEGVFSASGSASLAAYVRTEYETNKNVPDTQFIIKVSPENEFTILTNLLTPKSRGFIKLNATDPIWGSPLIYPGYLTAESDLKRIIQGIRIGLSLFNTSTMIKNNLKLNTTAMHPCENFKFNSDEYWTCVVRQVGSTFYHPVGTCKMGPKGDSEAVVDPRLRVHGIKRLRVIDASVMPLITRGNTNAPTIMLAEKTSDLIKEDWSREINKVKSE